MACSKSKIEDKLSEIATAIQKVRLDEMEKSLASEKKELELKCEVKRLQAELEETKESNKKLLDLNASYIEASLVAQEFLEKCPHCEESNWVRILKNN